MPPGVMAAQRSLEPLVEVRILRGQCQVGEQMKPGYPDGCPGFVLAAIARSFQGVSMLTQVHRFGDDETVRADEPFISFPEGAPDVQETRLDPACRCGLCRWRLPGCDRGHGGSPWPRSRYCG